MNNLKHKIAIITGAQRGMGRAIAERIAAEGALTIIAYATDEQLAEETVQGILSAGGKATAIPTDITKKEQVDRLFEKCTSVYGRPDILVNNAGVAGLFPLEQTQEGDFDRIFNVNAKGTLFCLSAAARHLNSNGRIINISSSTVAFPFEGASIYAGSKAAVRAFTEVAARELGGRGITVNTILPGVTETPMTAHFDSDFKNRVAATSPLNRIGLPKDIADTIMVLLGEDAHWITGQHILANGGGRV